MVFYAIRLLRARLVFLQVLWCYGLLVFWCFLKGFMVFWSFGFMVFLPIRLLRADYLSKRIFFRDIKVLARDQKEGHKTIIP